MTVLSPSYARECWNHMHKTELCKTLPGHNIYLSYIAGAMKPEGSCVTVYSVWGNAPVKVNIILESVSLWINGHCVLVGLNLNMFLLIQALIASRHQIMISTPFSHPLAEVQYTWRESYFNSNNFEGINLENRFFFPSGNKSLQYFHTNTYFWQLFVICDPSEQY